MKKLWLAEIGTRQACLWMAATIRLVFCWHLAFQNPYIPSIRFLTERLSLLHHFQKVDDFIVLYYPMVLLERSTFEWVHQITTLLKNPINESFVFALMLTQPIFNYLFVLISKAFVWLNQFVESFSETWVAALIELRRCLWFKLVKSVRISEEFVSSDSLLCLSELPVLDIHLFLFIYHM